MGRGVNISFDMELSIWVKVPSFGSDDHKECVDASFSDRFVAVYYGRRHQKGDRKRAA